MTRPVTRAEKIAAIQRQRENSVAIAGGLHKHLMEVTGRLAEIERIRSDLTDRVDDEARGLLQSWALPLSDLRDQVVRERAELERARTRLGRSALSVGMVGRARQGKSKFLQSLTGLSTREIPDGSKGFCTGVPSVVQHVPGGQTYASVYFHSPESFMTEVIAPYYVKLKLGPTPSSVVAFSGKPLPALPDGSGAEDKATYDHLTAYHRLYPEYDSLIGATSPRRIGADEIRGFVAQDDESGERRYNAFRAVRKVQIFTEFPQPDLSGISVIDLPGLGDTNLGDSSIMLSALQDDVDLVLFLRRPAPEGDGIHDHDVRLYDIAKDSLPEIPMQRRSFLMLNHRMSSDASLDNKGSCESFKSQVAGSPIQVAEVVIADCSSSTDVAGAFDHVVDYLLDNVNDLDQLVLDERNRRVAEINERARQLISELEALGKYAQTDGDDQFLEFQNRFKKAHKGMSSGIERLVSYYRSESDKEDGILRKAVDEVVEEAAANDGIPSISEIEGLKAEHGTYIATYAHLLDEARAHLSRKFLTLDTALKGAVNQMWMTAASVLADDGQLGQVEALSDLKGRDFLIGLAEYIPPRVRENQKSEVKYALEILINFDLAYRSFIQHRVRDCLNGLQADHPRIVLPPNMTPEPDAPVVREALTQSYQGTLWDCRQRLEELLKEPNRALFGIVEEFSDRVRRSVGIRDEWEVIYRNLRTEIWADHFAALTQNAMHLRTWNEAVQGLKEYLNSTASRPFVTNSR